MGFPSGRSGSRCQPGIAVVAGRRNSVAPRRAAWLASLLVPFGPGTRRLFVLPALGAITWLAGELRHCQRLSRHCRRFACGPLAGLAAIGFPCFEGKLAPLVALLLWRFVHVFSRLYYECLRRFTGQLQLMATSLADLALAHRHGRRTLFMGVDIATHAPPAGNAGGHTWFAALGCGIVSLLSTNDGMALLAAD